MNNSSLKRVALSLAKTKGLKIFQGYFLVFRFLKSTCSLLGVLSLILGSGLGCQQNLPSAQSEQTFNTPLDNESSNKKSKTQYIEEETFFSTLVSLNITPSQIVLGTGEKIKISAQATFVSGATEDVTDLVAWEISNPSLATIRQDSGVHLEGILTGSVELKGFYKSKFSQVDVSIISRDVESIEIVANNLSLGVPQEVRAIAYYADGTNSNVSSEVEWIAADQDLLEVSGTPPVATPLLVGNTLLTATLGTVKGLKVLEIPLPDDLESIRIISPPNDFTPFQGSAKAKLEATLSGGQVLDYTEFTRWTSSNKQKMNVSMVPGKRGLVSGLELGPVSLTAQIGTFSETISLPVSYGCTSFSILPSSTITAYLSSQSQLRVECVLANGTVVDKTADAEISFSSDDVEVETSGSYKGLITPLSLTSAPVTGTVSLENTTQSFTIEVEGKSLKSIEIKQLPDLSLCDNSTPKQLVAEGTYGEGASAEVFDITNIVTWSITDISVATIDNSAGSEGKLSMVNPGSANVVATATAIDGSFISASVPFEIGDPTYKSVQISAYEFDKNSTKDRGRLLEPVYSHRAGTTTILAGWLSRTCGADQDITISANSTWTKDPEFSLISQKGSKAAGALVYNITRNIYLSYQASDMQSPLSTQISFDITPPEVDRLEVRFTDLGYLPPGSSTPYWVDRDNTTSLKAFAIFTDGSELDVTSADELLDSNGVHKITVNWMSENTNFADVGQNTGVVTGKLEGNVSIKAFLDLDYIDANRVDLVSLGYGLRFDGDAVGIDVRSPCLSNNSRYALYCYELSAPGESCDQTCSGGAADVNMDALFLAGDSNPVCATIVNNLTGGSYSVLQHPPLEIGCALDINLARGSDVITSSSFFPGAQRVCSCYN